MTTSINHHDEAKQNLAFAQTNTANATAVLHALLTAQVHATLALSASVDDLRHEVRECFIDPMNHLQNASNNLPHYVERLEQALDNVAAGVMQ